MTCPHLKDGRCALAELLAEQTLGLTPQCPVEPSDCLSCQKSGAASEESPTAEVLAAVTRTTPLSHMVRWASHTTEVRTGRRRPEPRVAVGSPGPERKQRARPAPAAPPKPRRPGVGSTISKMLYERWKVTAEEACGCSGLIAKYDRWGPDKCEAETESIVEKLLAKAKQKPGLHRIAPDWASRIYLRGLVAEAIETVRNWPPA